MQVPETVDTITLVRCQRLSSHGCHLKLSKISVARRIPLYTKIIIKKKYEKRLHLLINHFFLMYIFFNRNLKVKFKKIESKILIYQHTKIIYTHTKKKKKEFP